MWGINLYSHFSYVSIKYDMQLRERLCVAPLSYAAMLNVKDMDWEEQKGPFKWDDDVNGKRDLGNGQTDAEMVLTAPVGPGSRCRDGREPKPCMQSRDMLLYTKA